ncbi:MAG: peptidoglycan bridge formation glycyltransferase FemA/FemB family protein [Candidatus Doudnabacteria bacterium]|nr:peptidoglycan bridge formation glycyltransferase FemA/FemB family protein [Candidatus Doudnabacteria bacterium]
MLSNLTQEAWDKKVIELGGSILQSWAWGGFQQALGNKIYRLSGETFITLAVELPLKAGKKYLYCPRGPLGAVEEALADLKNLSEQDHGIVFARLEPNTALDLPSAAKEVQPKHNWMLNMEGKTPEQLLMEMKPKTRYNINLAQRKGVTVREGRKEDLLEVWKLFLETATRNKFSLHPQNYYWQMLESLPPKHLKILIAEYKGQMLAAMLVTLFSDAATYLHGGSGNQMKEAMAPYLLHWEAINLAKDLGYKLYDFGGVAPAEKQDHSWAGVSRFKKSFGGFGVDYPGAYDLVFSPVWYNVYKQARLVRRLVISNK